MKILKIILLFLAFLPLYGVLAEDSNANSTDILEHYFELEGNVQPSCQSALRNSLLTIPLELRKYLTKEIQRRGSKYIFKRESFEAAEKLLGRGSEGNGRGGMPGVPVKIKGL